MAQIVPSDITNLALAGATDPELQTLADLKAKLSPAYTIFHGIHWSREYASATVFGELDFVIVNQAGRVLVVEQKNGSLEETEAGLVKRYPGQVKLVGEQVRRSLEGIREKFKWMHGPRPGLDLDYLIYCPDHRVVHLNAAALDPTRIVDATSRQVLADRIEQILQPGAPGPDEWVDRVLGFFQQTFEVVPDIHAHVSKQEKTFTRLSGPLVKLLVGLEMTPLRLRIFGTAGCGKSLIAQRFYQVALAKGKRPLLVCFNRPLAEKLKATLPSGGFVASFHGLCDKFLKSQGRQPDYTDWSRLVELVVGEQVPDSWKFDSLIVDEGQDFEREWVEVLHLFLHDEPDILWLEDPDQNLRDQPPVPLPHFVSYRTRANYRTPESIARFIRHAVPIEFECANVLPGLGVGVTHYEESAEQPAHVARIVDSLVRRGFHHGDIVILTLRGAQHAVLSTRERVGNFTLRRFTGEYDLFGNQVLTKGQITFDSVRRFKGQQAPAVILVDVENDPAHPERMQRLLFTGMTRATVRLEVVMKGEP